MTKRSRSKITLISITANSGMRASAPLSSSALIEYAVQSVFATAVALLGWSVITAISPTTSPVETVSSTRPPTLSVTCPCAR